ncbi:MAG: hypothetical protein M3406_16970 [Chloroflexota bacterium]|nr:hypothetical protein [Chloroflexota bacterium]
MRGPADHRSSTDSLFARAWWLHPLLFAAFPVLILFADNIGQHVSVQPLAAPLGLAVGGAAVLVTLAAIFGRVLVGSASRGALLATVAIALFFGYGYAWSAVGEILRVHRYLLVTWGLLLLMGAVVAWRLRPNLVGRTTAALNVMGMILVAMNMVPIADFGLRQANRAPISSSPAVSGALDGPRRDVWYLIFDRYAGQEALGEVYGFDNSAFIDELRGRGFYVAEQSTANYLKTAHSLASSLNLDYLDMEQLRAAAAKPDDWTPLYETLQGSHAVERVLAEQGYHYVHLGLRRGATYTNSEAEQVLLFSEQSEFSAVLADTTVLLSLENVLGREAPGTLTMYRNQTLFQFDRLDELAQTAGPKFVFAHFMLPHPPYIFNADGSAVTPEQAAATSSQERYVNQIRFANDRILDLLDLLLDGPAEEWPIIVVQSDEGPFPTRYERDELAFEWLEATDEELLQKFSILNAILLPGVDPAEAGLYPTITPVNNFRLIFNAAFGADLPLLPDRNLVFPNQGSIYEQVDITDRVQH